jgi:hypothetical protein
MLRPGTDKITCQIETGQSSDILREINAVQVVEFIDENRDVVKQRDFNGTLSNDDVITYRSFAADNPNVLIAGMAIILYGKNIWEQEISNRIDVMYTNECGVPTFEVGDSIGWVTIVSSCAILPCFQSLADPSHSGAFLLCRILLSLLLVVVTLHHILLLHLCQQVQQCNRR